MRPATIHQESPMVDVPKEKAAEPPKRTINFLTFFEEVDEGRLAATATDELAVLVREIHNLSKIEGLKPKGKLRIEITVQSNKTVLDVVGEVKCVLPKRPRSGSSFFRTRDNMLTAVNPSQLGIEFRDVTEPARPRVVD